MSTNMPGLKRDTYEKIRAIRNKETTTVLLP